MRPCLVFLVSLVLHNSAAEDAAVPFKDQCVKTHNEFRHKHQVGDVIWDDTLAQGATDWANHLAENNLFEHAKGIQPGENLYMIGGRPKEPCTAATKAFYGEVKNYDFNKPGFSMNTGHFTQVVWKNTKQIGAAQAIRNDSKLVVVIRYLPGGNYLSEKAFKDNVLPPAEGGAGQQSSSLTFNLLVITVGAAIRFFF